MSLLEVVLVVVVLKVIEVVVVVLDIMRLEVKVRDNHEREKALSAL